MILLVGCNKSSIQEGNFQPITLQSIERGPGVLPTTTNGMLNFSSFDDFNDFIKSLKDQESDAQQVNVAYASLGINTTAESIINLTDNPICLITEMAINGFSSARKVEETSINTALNQGLDVNSVIIDPYWKTALNADNAVHIGKRIYKYYPNGGIAMVLNNDWALYESIRLSSYESLHQTFNLIVTSEDSYKSNEFFNLNSDGSILSEKPIFSPNTICNVTNEGKLNVQNISEVESTTGNVTYQWKYSDNSISNGLNPDKSIGKNEQLTLIVNNGIRQVSLAANKVLECDVSTFTITYLNNNKIRFECPGWTPTIGTYDLKWVFSNGTSNSNINPVTKTFTDNGTVTCQWLFKGTTTVACTATKTFVIKCGEKKFVEPSFIFNNVGGSGQKWKLDCKLWVSNGQIGCKVKYLRKYTVGWLPAFNQGACSDLAGIYKREVNTPTGKICNDISATGSKCLGSGTYPTTVEFLINDPTAVFSSPGLLNSGHMILVNGTWVGPGTGLTPRLVLL
jgi:hypothetical protein